MKSAKRFLLLSVSLMLPLVFAGSHVAQQGTFLNPDEARRQIVQDFKAALRVAQTNYAGQLDHEAIIKDSIVGMLLTLDPHSSYFTRKEYDEFMNDQRSRYTGIGAEIAQRSGKVFIMSPFANTPALRGGIRFGDEILAVNGETMEGRSSLQVSEKLLGPEGTPVMVKVGRLGVSQPIELKFTRAAISHPSITNYHLTGDGIGYINLERGFNTTTFEEMKSALRDLKAQGMTALILDLRGNRGGLVDQAYRVADLFLHRGQKIVSMRGREGVFAPVERYAQNSLPQDYPFVVLINRGSASASEIVAGAWQDHDRAVIVGEESFGKALVQNVFTLSDGSGLTLTTGHYYTPSGRLIQREYAGRSFYDYYLRRDDRDAGQPASESHTDGGRTVYSGGGIEPDVKVKLSPHEIERQNLWLEPVFHFARALAAGLIPEAPELKIDRPADHTHRLRSDEYRIDDKLLAAFKAFLRHRPELNADALRAEQDWQWIKRQIRYDLVTAAYGRNAARAVLLENDPQFERAIAEMPNAKAMAEEFRRERMVARPGKIQ